MVQKAFDQSTWLAVRRIFYAVLVTVVFIAVLGLLSSSRALYDSSGGSPTMPAMFLALIVTIVVLFVAWRIELVLIRRHVVGGAPGVAATAILVCSEPALRAIVDVLAKDPKKRWTTAEVAEGISGSPTFAFEQLCRLADLGIVFTGPIRDGDRSWTFKAEAWRVTVEAYSQWQAGLLDSVNVPANPDAFADARASSDAIAALTFSIVGLVVCPIVGSVIALRYAKRAQEVVAVGGAPANDAGLVTASRWLAWIGIASGVVYVVVGAVVAFPSARG